MSSCCHVPETKEESCHNQSKGRDYILIFSMLVVFIFYVAYFSLDLNAIDIHLSKFAHKVVMLIHKMAPGFIIAVIFVGFMQKVPREVILKILGQKKGLKGLIRATMAGILLDLCSHGILLVGMDLYKKGARLGQVMAFLIASPWNSFSLTIILFTLIGVPLTLFFIALSIVIALVSGLIFDLMVDKKILPENPQSKKVDLNGISITQEFFKLLKMKNFKPSNIIDVIKSGLKESNILVKWLLVGVILSALIEAFMSDQSFQTYFGSTLLGLTVTVLVATIIEVCSEGSAPIAADILTKGGSVGNSFTFLMAGVSTDYTEVMVIKESMSSWKIALFLPLITLPQIILVGWTINQF